MPTMRHALEKAEKLKKFDIIFNLHVTAPLRNINDIKNSYEQFINENRIN